VEIEYGTGTSYGYRYYLVNTAAAPLVYFPPDRFNSGYGYYDASTVDGRARLFAQDAERSVSIDWSPFGDRLYFSFYNERGDEDPYEMVFPDGVAERSRLEVRGGEYSPDGRYIAWFSRASGRLRLHVNDVALGNIQYYCLPQISNDQSSPEGLIVRWSPDSRYLAAQAVMARDGEEHLLIVNRETGDVVDLSAGVYQLITWAEEPGSYGEGTVSTPLPTATLAPEGNGG
jgi:Tol biopolymer transport system component